MISLKELEYVNSFPNQMPYPGSGYNEQAMEDLKQAFVTFEKYYKNREYCITFSNGEEIDLEILPKNLCHMVGINTKDLLGEYRSDFRKNVLNIDPTQCISSYELLKLILENSERVLSYNAKQPLLNGYRIRVKCRIFDKISDFGKFDFGCINFDKDLYSQTNGSSMGSNSTKYLYVQSNEGNCPFFMMGIMPDSYTKKHIVETLVAPTNPKSYFENQEVIIPTQLLNFNVNELNKLNASASEKIALLNIYKAIVNRYGISLCINIYNDYEAMLGDSVNTPEPVLKRTI